MFMFLKLFYKFNCIFVLSIAYFVFFCGEVSASPLFMTAQLRSFRRILFFYLLSPSLSCMHIQCLLFILLFLCLVLPLLKGFSCFILIPFPLSSVKSPFLLILLLNLLFFWSFGMDSYIHFYGMEVYYLF